MTYSLWKCHSGLIAPDVDAGTQYLTGFYVGALVGKSHGRIYSCCVDGGSIAGNEIVGGLVGENVGGVISNCYSTAAVSGRSHNVGGLVGQNSGAIANCYATGPVSLSGDGLVGKNTGVITASFWNTETSGRSSSSNGIGMTTAQMQMGITFVAWVDEEVWTIDEDGGYPKLLWQNEPGQLITNPFAGGVGSESDPYQVATEAQLNRISTYPSEWGKHFILIEDVDLGADTETQFNPIGYYSSASDHTPFTGVFDGQGHSISNFSYASTEGHSVGFFGYVKGAGTLHADPAQIKDLVLIDPNIEAERSPDVGALVGRFDGSTSIEHCHVIGGAIRGDRNVGGLVGRSGYGGGIKACTSSAEVSGNSQIGGLVGENGCEISDCSSSGKIAGDDSVGGLAGSNGGAISGSEATGRVIGAGARIGGLVGSNHRDVVDCNAFGDVEGTSGVGGLVGCNRNFGGSVLSSNAWGAVVGHQNIGGLVGDNGGNIESSCAMGEISGEDAVGGLVGWSNGNITTQCSASGDVEGDKMVGGLVGRNLGLIQDCQATGAVSGNREVGGLAGYSRDRITNCYATGRVDANEAVGGLIGRYDGSWGGVYNCDASGDVMGESDVGGLVGSCDSGTVSGCSSSASVIGLSFIGGLIGHNSLGSVIECSASGPVDGNDVVGGLVGQNDWLVARCKAAQRVVGNAHVGGLTGHNRGTLYNCYASATVVGSENVGGLAGCNEDTIFTCYSRGSVTGGTSVGGLVGKDLKGRIFNCFWDIEASHQLDSAGGTGLSTAEMRMADTFLPWGAEGVWTIDHGQDYPRLIWEQEPGDAIVGPSGLAELVGTGTSEDPYMIRTAEELNRIGLCPSDWGKHYKLTADIDAGTVAGGHVNPIGAVGLPFAGVFDGERHTISGMRLAWPNMQCIGLFRYVSGQDARICDLGLIDPNVDAGDGQTVGSLVGRLESGAVAKCHVQGIRVQGRSRVGGLVGHSIYGRISTCYSTGRVSAAQDVGGLVGLNVGLVADSYSWCWTRGKTNVGGLIGENSTPNSFFTVTRCYAAGLVTASEQAGGLIGGGLSAPDEVKSCFWDRDVSDQATSVGGTGIVTNEMKMAKTFLDEGWDFYGSDAEGIEDLWYMPDDSYPVLSWQSEITGLASVPDVTNLPLDVAQSELQAAGFAIGDIESVYQEEVTTPGVWATSPVASRYAPLGSPVDIVFSIGPYDWSQNPGDGTEADPYEIQTVDHLNALRRHPELWGASFVLAADIDMQGRKCIGYVLADSFTGVFNGAGHKIANIVLQPSGDMGSGTERQVFGVFGTLATDARVSGLVLENIRLSCPSDGTGGLLAGENLGTVGGCYSSGSVLGGYAGGGLVGHNSGRISNCQSTAVTSADRGGGLVGANDGVITNFVT